MSITTAAEILAQVDIVEVVGSYIKLEKAGDNFRARCPFHSDLDPSLSVSPKLNIFRCFGAGCQEGGNAANFIALYEDLNYYQALSKLAKRIGKPELAPEIEAEEFDDMYEINQIVLGLYQKTLFTKSDVSQRARSILRERRITQETAQRFGIGYSPNTWTWLVHQNLNKGLLRRANLISVSEAGLERDFFKNRIIFPIYYSKKLVGFTGRTLGTARKIPKYLNSRDSPWFKKQNIIYGWDLGRDNIRRNHHVVIVEGQMDVLQLFQRGIINTVAISGSYFGPNQATFISKLIERATIFADGDKAGVEAGLRVGEHLVIRGIDVEILFIKGKDPDEAAKYKHRFDWQKINKEYSYSLGAFAFKFKGLEEAMKRVSSIQNKIKLSYALRELSELSGYDERHLEHWLIEYKRAPLDAPSIDPQQHQLSLREELILLAAYTGRISLNKYMRRKLGTNFVQSLQDQKEGSLQQLADGTKYASRLHTLDQIKDIGQYSKDLIARVGIKFMEEDIIKFKKKFQESKDPKHLDRIEKRIKTINKLKLRLKHGRHYGENGTGYHN